MLEGEVLKVVMQVTVAASGFYPGDHVIKSSGAGVSNTNFLVSKSFYADMRHLCVQRFMCKKPKLVNLLLCFIKNT